MRSREEIEELTTQVEQAPHHRQAQQTLARDMTALVHGPQAAVEVERAAQALFGQAIAELNESTLLDVMSEAPSLELPATAFDHGGLELVDLLTRTQLCASKGAARKDISAGGIYVNNRRIQDVGNRVCRSDALHGRYLVLRKGKKNFFLVKLMV